MLRKAIAKLRLSGCKGNLSKNIYTISNISGWDNYLLARSVAKELAIVALVKSTINTKPVKTVPRKHFKEPDIMCQYCGKYNQYRCTYHNKLAGIPAGTLRKGCEHFEDSRHVYF